MSAFNYSKWDDLDSDSESEVVVDSGTKFGKPSSEMEVSKGGNSSVSESVSESPHASTTSPYPPTEEATHIDGVASTIAGASSTPLPSKSNKAGHPPKMKMTAEGSAEGRYAYTHGGHKVYEWSQSLDSVSIFIHPPPPVPGNLIYVEIKPNEVTVGLKGADTGPFIKEETGGLVDVGESTWVMDGEGEGREIEIVLTKGKRGELWSSALKGREGGAGGEALDPQAMEKVKKEMMIERFQEENPGFDFRNADFNGQVPDARNFMGGVGYT
ncbi:hypothetical protein TrCOL_g6913 [Triparma columacea]|uniref:CS domain-containing protein n=1 Tax=Triparma columacea TaxID=722753 RepID=A0A9W7LCQ6_9STRA|nr:hypothetical protein TrCOL_g6913 [Triparma columacea]